MRMRGRPLLILTVALLAACSGPSAAGRTTSTPPPRAHSPSPSIAEAAPLSNHPDDLCPRPWCRSGAFSGFRIDDAWARAIGLLRVWSLTHGGGATVVLLDLGVGNLADLRGKVVQRIDGRGLAPTRDPIAESHGTAMASIIAARTDNGEGIAGVGWDTRIVSVDMGDTYAHFTTLRQERPWDRKHIVALFRQAAAVPGARIISFSSIVNPSRALAREIERIIHSGIVVVAAAGNESRPGVRTLRYPAAYPGVIGVGGAIVAPDGSVGIWTGSNVGSQVDVYSPTFVPALFDHGSVDLVAGTSPATALTSGVLSLLLSEYPNLTPARVQRLLVATATPFPARVLDREASSGGAILGPFDLPTPSRVRPRLLNAAALFAAAAGAAGG